MYVKRTTFPNGRVYLAISESYRQNGRPKARTVKSLGYVDELQKEHEDVFGWATEVAATLTKKKKEEEKAVSIDIYPKQKINRHFSARKNIGCAPLLCLYASLGISEALKSKTRYKKIDFDINAVMRLLVMERILYPSSKKQALENKERYFFKSEFSPPQLYRALSLLARAKDSVVASMNKQIEKAGLRDESSVFFDVTNYYFETEEDDLRKKGVSKEHRPNPIVQMGLLQDKNAIPLTYKLFSGNTHDSQTLLPSLKDIKEEMGLNRVVAVADKGINASDNIAALLSQKDGFVFSQSIRGTKSDKALKEWVLCEKDYKTKDGGAFKIKSKQAKKTLHLKAEDCFGGRAKDIEIEVKYVSFWSRKYAERARKKREKVVQKAYDLCQRPGAYTKATSQGAARFVKHIAFAKDTGEIVSGEALCIDEKAIEDEAKTDGFYLIVTSEIHWSNERILDTYRELWRIEESFKITKSELKARPVHVWTREHIEAHFLTCYVALCILRILELRTGLCSSVIRRELKKMNGTNLDTNWWLFNHRTKESDKIADVFSLEELKLKNMRTQDIRAMFAKAKRLGLHYKY